MHRIYVKNEQDKEAYTPAMRSYIQAAVKETLKYEEFEDQCEVSVTLTDNDGIRKLNAQYRGKDKEKEKDTDLEALIELESEEKASETSGLDD